MFHCRLFYSTLLSLLCFNAISAQPSNRPFSVGIFVYEGVEILDFTGPAEVFGSTEGFKPFIVAVSKKPVLSQGYITVVPQYSIDDCPPTDILMFPGGNSGPLVEDKKLIDWIKQRSTNTQFMMSVCTGASLLSKAGLLDGLDVTTWYGFIPELQKMTPKARVLTQTRFIDNGHVVTTAGVSAGIDGALQVVSRIKGEKVAKATARYMEYDKWNPREGKVFESAFVTAVRKQGLEAALKTIQPTPEALQPLYYPGELINLAAEFLPSKPEYSEALYQHLLRSGAATPVLYDGLADVWQKMGKPAPPNSSVFMEKLESGELEWAQKTYAETVAQHPGWLFFSEQGLNDLAYRVVLSDKTRAVEANAIFLWITELYPKSPNAWDSLAESYELLGIPQKAVAASEQCLAKLPESGLDEATKALYLKISSERISRLKTKP